jgi:ferredoxin
MTEDVYKKLAQLLDTLPNRFPATPSGVEFRMLEKIFTPEEAAVALAMSLEPQSFQAIAEKSGAVPMETRNTLKRMSAKGLADLKKGEGEFLYALRPFVVGFYEGQLPRMDKEMAELFEEYYHETKGGVLRPMPALHRVIPVEKVIPVKIDIHPYERASEMIESAQAWGVRECICRKQQQLLGKPCTHQLETCIVFSKTKNAFDRSTVDRAITKEEALKILQETEEAGLVHSSGNYQDGHEYICNCCICCCGIMRGIAEYGITSAIAHSDFQAVVTEDLCNACEACLSRCQFNALSMQETIVAVDVKRCVGCGLCVLVCPTEALSIGLRSAKEITVPPVNIAEWRTQRTSGSAD